MRVVGRKPRLLFCSLTPLSAIFDLTGKVYSKFPSERGVTMHQPAKVHDSRKYDSTLEAKAIQSQAESPTLTERKEK